MSLDTTIPGGIYQSADGSYHDAWGKTIADPNKSAIVPEVSEKEDGSTEVLTEVTELRTLEGGISLVEGASDETVEGETIVIEEADGEIVTLDAPKKKTKKA